MLRRRSSIHRILLLALLLAPAPASAANGFWLWFEYRLPIIGNASTRPPRFSLRIVSDTRIFDSTRGLDEGFLRIGGIFDVNRWFWLAVNGSVYVDRQVPSLAYVPEARLEIEPHFTARFWHFSLDDRNRLEFRHRDAVQRVRYRNMLRINYEHPGVRWIPFIFNEWLFNLDVGFDQNRLAGGIAVKIHDYIRIDFAYMLRSIRTATSPWTHDNVGLVYLFVGLPPGKKAVRHAAASSVPSGPF